MALHDDILIEIKNRRIPENFCISDLLFYPVDENKTRFRIGENDYAISSIRTIPNNHSRGPGSRLGANVGTADQAKYEKLSKGRFKLIKTKVPIEESSVDETSPQKQEGGPVDSKTSAVAKLGIFQNFVDYISNKPFRLCVNGLGWYPDEPAIGWKERLDAYAWPLKTNPPNEKFQWVKTKEKLEDISCNLKTLIDHDDMNAKIGRDKAQEIYDQIRAWGNRRGRERSGAEVISRIRAVLPPDEPASNSEVDSTLTKLYALAAPEHFVIYDSRVACAIVSIAEDIYRGRRIETFRRQFSKLGHMDYAASSGTRPRGRREGSWPNAYQSWRAQLEANELCVGIRECLVDSSTDGKDDWTLREVEAVLFMEGY